MPWAGLSGATIGLETALRFHESWKGQCAMVYGGCGGKGDAANRSCESEDRGE